MFNGMKSRRRLALLIAFALSAGGQLYHHSAYAADVTGGDVLVDGTAAHPIPVAPIAGGAITNAADNGNVYGNKLTLDGSSTLWFAGTVYGGYTMGSGNATGNELIFTNGAGISGNVYGGWANNGDATGNTVTLSGNHSISYGNTNLYGGGSNKSGADVRTDNKLRVTTAGNRAYTINNFEQMEYVLGSGINSGDTMLNVNAWNSMPQLRYDWNKIRVTGLRDWATTLAAAGVNTPTLTLYTTGSAALTLNNYAPTIVGTRGDYEFGKRANGSLSGTTMTGATQVTLDGNRFQNAGKNQNVTTPGATTRGTYAGLSVYGNTTNNNELNITGGNHVNARAGYTDAQSGGSDENTLNLRTGGSVTNGYAGYTTGINLLVNPEDEDHPELVDTTKNADAKKNIVNIQGGTLNAGGKLYGGYIATNTALSAASAGDASGNTINIEDGTFGSNTELYGGYTNGTGKATDNIVNLGTTAGVLSASTLNNVFIYGGAGGSASDVMTGNTLNVNTQNITARGVTNFGKTVFNINSTTAVGNTLLTVSGGATTGLDWAGVEVNPGSFTFTPSTYNEHLFTAMHNGSGITFSNYAAHGAKEKIVGDFEYIIDTANHTGAAQDVYIDGFRFKNHTATYNETTAHDAAWAGRTASGQAVTDNQLTISGGTLTTAAYGGLVENKKHNSDGTFQTTAGDAKKNALEVTGGIITNAYGVKMDVAGGNAEENSVKITSGTISGSAYGADLSAATSTGTGTKNKAEMTNGSLNGSLYGAHTAGSGALSGSEVSVSGGSISGSVFGSDVASGTGGATVSKITLTGGSITGSVYGGRAAGTGAATGHTLNLNGGSVGGDVYGGHTASGATTGNIINLGSGTTNAVTTVTGTIYGGNQTADTGNILNVNTNATAGNIANFGMVNFNFNSTFNQANPMLTLNGGSATNFDWNKFTHTGNAPSGQSILMQNLSNINVANYTGAKEISSTGTNEYTIDTDTNTATATQILFGGYQFKGANPTSLTSDAGKDVWAGRSVIGNTTTGNILTINGTTHRDAYGGWTAGTGTTAAEKFDSADNTVNLQNGTVRNIYGGLTSVQTGNATGNKVNISGGTVAPVSGVGGTVYGGYLSHTFATGNATGNIITITGGTMTDVYGGYANGSGATTGNTVNLGTETDAVAGTTTISGTIYGGNKATAANNTLNVYDSVTVGNIQNFDTVNFKATSSHIATGDTLLTLNGGSATNLDWTKLHVDNLDSLTASATEDRILTLLQNGNNINLANYSTIGTRGRIHTTDYEADITTDGNSATTQNVYLKGYRFQNNTGGELCGRLCDGGVGRTFHHREQSAEEHIDAHGWQCDTYCARRHGLQHRAGQPWQS